MPSWRVSTRAGIVCALMGIVKPNGAALYRLQEPVVAPRRSHIRCKADAREDRKRAGAAFDRVLRHIGDVKIGAACDTTSSELRRFTYHPLLACSSARPCRS